MAFLAITGLDLIRLDQDLKEPYITVSSLGLPTVSTHAAATTPKAMTLCSPQGSLLFPCKAIAFEQPARPYTPASRLRAPYTHTIRRPFFFGRPKFRQAASSRKKQ